jgi:hypothetical protein
MNEHDALKEPDQDRPDCWDWWIEGAAGDPRCELPSELFALLPEGIDPKGVAWGEWRSFASRQDALDALELARSRRRPNLHALRP